MIRIFGYKVVSALIPAHSKTRRLSQLRLTQMKKNPFKHKIFFYPHKGRKKKIFQTMSDNAAKIQCRIFQLESFPHRGDSGGGIVMVEGKGGSYSYTLVAVLSSGSLRN